VVYEDNHLVVVNKLPGELVQGDYTGDRPLLEKVRDYIGEKYQKPGQVFCGLVHRLDRPTSGLVLFARTSKALARCNRMFQDRAVSKTYYALVALAPHPPQGTLRHHLRKEAKQNKSYPSPENKAGAKLAVLHYRLLGQGQRYYLLEIELETGRHHQIRAQLAAAGMPIKGDLKYGFPRSNPDASISLHAGRLALVHPVSKEALELRAAPLSIDRAWEGLL